ncbi:sterile20-like kinase isoform b-related [Anaeramoeba flamelloides]|uniref:non-specific serine/threonine protein kinase n=1 Tax=Anaeramoeba flamelloides TaxID=1746091 RepID=A0AAV7Y7E0_9EUKA|nr:sterile20-like kinase isoform b-related [Anaeramoeba flamelloides]
MTLHSIIDYKQNPNELYEVLEKLGEGNYASVYKGKHKKNGNIVAIKQISIDTDEDIQELIAEIEIMKQLDHENIVKYYGTYFHNDCLWIIMECCDGGSCIDLYEKLREGLNEEYAAAIIYGSLAGLVYFHGQKKIHRDIKGGNILLTKEGKVKLADFGVSAQLTPLIEKRNTKIGTPYWMAPEVIEQTNGYDEKCDIWSLAITAIELCEAQVPRMDMHPMRVIFMIPKSDPPTLTNPNMFSKELNDFLTKSLQKDPKKRPSAKELLKHPWMLKGKQLYEENILVEIIEKAMEMDSYDSSYSGSDNYSSEGGFDENITATQFLENLEMNEDYYFSNSESDESLIFTGKKQKQKESNEHTRNNKQYNDIALLQQRSITRVLSIQNLLEEESFVKKKKEENKNEFLKKIDKLKQVNSVVEIPFINVSSIDPLSFFNEDPIEDHKDEERFLESLNTLGGGDEIDYENSLLTSSCENLITILDYQNRLKQEQPLLAEKSDKNSKLSIQLRTTIKTLLKF